MPVTSYSTTAANNNSAAPSGAPEGWAPSSVNNTIRQIMADIATEAQKNAVKVLGSVSGTNTITASMSPALVAYSAGMIVVLTPANSNSGATTLNINSLGALDVQKADGDALISGDLVAGIPAVLVLDSGADDWILLNPQASVNGVDTSDFARLSQSNTFTGATLALSNASPVFEIIDSNAVADRGRVRMQTGSSSFSMSAVSDDGNTSNSFLSLSTTGTASPSVLNLQATSVQANGVEVGFRGIPQNAQSGNYTCVLGDAGKHIYHGSSDGSGDTYTIPANSSVAYAVGTAITFVNSASSSVSIAITTDTMTLAGTTSTGTRTLGQNGIATAVKVTSTGWIISGTGLT